MLRMPEKIAENPGVSPVRNAGPAPFSQSAEADEQGALPLAKSARRAPVDPLFGRRLG